MDIADLERARAALSEQRPYFSTVLYALRFVEWEHDVTLAVDDKLNLYWHRGIKWSHKELVTVLYHEISHVLRDHAGRCRRLQEEWKVQRPTLAFPRDIWNIASDCEINNDLRAEGLSFPKDRPGCFPETYNLLPEHTAERYFEILVKMAKQINKPQQSSCGSCQHGEHSPEEQEAAQGESPGVDVDQIRRDVAKGILAGSSHVAEGWVRWAKKHYIDPKIWKPHLATQIRRSITYTTGMVDYTYERPSRREGASGIILPAMRKPEPHIAVVLDISASMWGEPTRVALDALDSIFQHTGVAGLTLLPTNTKVVSVIRNLRTLSGRDIPEGGGTDMTKGIEFARQLRPRPSVLIVLTDGETAWPKSAPPEFAVVIGLVLGSYEAKQSLSAYSRKPPAWARVVEIFYTED
jgi:predicted metal-dependent peptidase